MTINEKKSTAKVEVDGEELVVTYSRHAQERLRERDVTLWESTSALVAAGEELLTMKNGQEFAVVDMENNFTVIASVNCDGEGEISIDVITVVDTALVYVKLGTRVIKIGSYLRGGMGIG